MTRPISLSEAAPSSVLIASMAALVSASFVERDRLAALLRHFLQNLDHQRIVVGLASGGAQLDIAVLDLGEDQADGREAVLLARLHRADLRGFDGVSNHKLFHSIDVVAALGLSPVCDNLRGLRGFV
jgi:hypothetical protein